VQLDARGFVKTTRAAHGQTRIGHRGRRGEPMLAHKATHQGGPWWMPCCRKTVFEPRAIPAVMFTDGSGLVRVDGHAGPGAGNRVKTAKFPWGASVAPRRPRADGLTKVIADPRPDACWARIAARGRRADAEAALAIENAPR
jgi:pyruvate/2-oxoglutarate dehydrogenase complex dihydrolipoamide dehydrogenase (E3) component